jgi:DNA polymerase III epsilon subunit-like protein
MFDKSLVVLDIETGGLTHDRPILEIGAIRYNTSTWEEISVFHRYVGPDPDTSLSSYLANCTQEALVLTGLDKKTEEIGQSPSIAHTLIALKKWLRTEPYILAGQNVQFDINFIKHYASSYQVDLGWCYRELGPTEDLRNYLRLYGAITGTQFNSFSLSKVAEQLNIPIEAHTAIGDVRATAAILCIIYTAFSKGF